MSSRTASSGQQGIRPGSHYAPYSVHTRRDINSASMQAGSNTSPGLFVSVVAGSHGGERPRNISLHASGASFKCLQIAQTLIDIGALLYVSFYLLLWVTVILGLIPFALFCLLLVSFH